MTYETMTVRLAPRSEMLLGQRLLLCAALARTYLACQPVCSRVRDVERGTEWRKANVPVGGPGAGWAPFPNATIVLLSMLCSTLALSHEQIVLLLRCVGGALHPRGACVNDYVACTV